MAEELAEAAFIRSVVDEAKEALWGGAGESYLRGRFVGKDEIQKFGVGALDGDAAKRLLLHHGVKDPDFERVVKWWQGCRIVFPVMNMLGEYVGFETRSIHEKDYAKCYVGTWSIGPVFFGLPQNLEMIWDGAVVCVTAGS